MAKLQSPRGTHDIFGDDILKYNHIVSTFSQVARDFGFAEISTPVFEFSPVFMKTLGDTSDIVNKEMYTFNDRGGEQLTLRPEGTAGVVRAFLQQGLTRNVPLKWFYQGPMFRYERPQKGRTRQFHQLGIEVLGAKDFKHDIDCISLADQTLKSICPEQKISLELNSLGDPESRNHFRQQLIDYLTPYKSELSEDSQVRLEKNPLRILDSKDKNDQKICQSAPSLHDCFNDTSKKVFHDICSALEALNINFNINKNIVRGLDYYNHCVFEFKCDQLGAQDTVLAGGRYDNLIAMMGGPQLSGVGFGAGIERLMLISETPVTTQKTTALLCLDDSIKNKCIEICHKLRVASVACEILDSGNMSKKMKKADKMAVDFALVIGVDELNNNTVTVKDLSTGDQTQVNLNNVVQWVVDQ